MSKVMICGYYGFNNIGDEAILQSIISDLKSIQPDIEISVLTYNAEQTRNNYKVKAISRSKILDIISNIKKCDLLIYGGGSLLQDVTSSKSLIFYLAILVLAKLFNKKVMFYCNGYGPVNKKINKLLVKQIVGKVDLITLRDVESKKNLEKLGIVDNIKITADAAFTMKSAGRERVKEIFKIESIPMDKKIIGISVRRWKNNEEVIDIISKTIDHFAENNINVLMIPMKYPEDLEFSLKIMENCKTNPYVINNQYTPEEVLGIIGELDMIVGIRLHSLVFAAIKGIPMVGIEYDPKVKSFIELLGQKNAGNINDLELANLCLCIEEVLCAKEKYRDKLAEKKEELIEKAKSAAKLAVQLLSE